MGLVLRVENAEFFYDAKHKNGFKEIDFFINHGEVLSILGPNGCGKTTLIKCLVGLYNLSKGDVWLDDKRMGDLDRREVAQFIGYVPQIHQPAFPFTVLDAVLVGRAPHLNMMESPGKKDMEIASKAIEAMGISGLKNRPYTQLSGGERQLVIFARVLAQQPSLIMLDEPTAHLDFGNQIRVLDLVEELASTGLPIIMTSHFPDHAFLMSSKVAVMKNGKFIAFGTPEDVITEENMEAIYGIKVKIMDLGDPINRRICVPIKNNTVPIPNKENLFNRSKYATRSFDS